MPELQEAVERLHDEIWNMNASIDLNVRDWRAVPIRQEMKRVIDKLYDLEDIVNKPEPWYKFWMRLFV